MPNISKVNPIHLNLSLGGGVPGISPTVTNTTQQGNSNVAPLGEASQIPRDRHILRKAFPNASVFNNSYVFSRSWPQTPFRVAMNAGDLLMRQNEPGGSNQIKGSVGTAGASRWSLSVTDNSHPGTGASGNQHYVYDSSVYTRYKKLNAKQKNYNDFSFGGSNNGAYTTIMAMRY
jgi:hypothetical protein